ncbi:MULTISPECIES: hypothetical protein [Stenotrophomonas]|uniref:hypothetical protein n=1 Tax=Stenotrophomonas TaxID=40323 RepID=UPI0028988EAB|nr:hypothetical protein [Stenotrophomonas indicatrix]
MKIANYRDVYYSFSSKTSDISRQLSFAGIAFIWVFKPEDAVPTAIPPELLWPAGLFVLALALDLLHAAYGTLAWGIFSRHHEKRGVALDDEFDAPSWLNWPALTFFWGKVLAVIVAYAVTLFYVWGLIH